MLTASVILIGMPGCGKSTVGKLLSKRLGVDFCDTDDLIVESTGEPLQETLNKYGRDGFLERERDVLMNFYTPIHFGTLYIIDQYGSLLNMNYAPIALALSNQFGHFQGQP